MTRLRNVGRTLGALAALGGLVVGVPVALAVGIGWPLPRQVPSLDELGRALNGSAISDGAIVGILAAVLWLAWAMFLACVAVEVVAAMRGHQARIPFAGTFARWLVASMTLATSLVGARPALADVVPSYGPAAVAVAQSELDAAPPAAQAPTAPTQAQDGTYLVVRPDDTLWDIAEETLGDPLRWPELFELNSGVEQPDGRWLRKPDLIRPGWRITLPAGATLSAPTPSEPTTGEEQGPERPAAVSTPGLAPTTTTAPETPSPTAALPTPTTVAAPMAVPTPLPTDAGRDTVATPDSGRADGSGADDEPGTEVPLPDPSAPRPVAENLAGRLARNVEPERQPPSPAPDGGGVLDGLPIPMNGQGLFGAALLGAGVVSVLQVRRRVQLRHRRSGEHIPLPEEELAGAELALRAGADPEGAAFIDLGLRALAGVVQSEGGEPPQLVGAQLGSRELEVVLAEPMSPAPPGFTTRQRGQRWVLPRSTDMDELEDLAEGVPAPMPGLVTLGTDDRGARVLLDLEDAGLTCIGGDVESARQLLYAAAAELATSPYGEYYSLVLVGFGEGLAPLERVRSVASLGEVIDDLERDAAEVGQLLAESGVGSTIEGRMRGAAADAWAPTLVLCAEAPPVRLARRLSAVVSEAGNGGVGVLVAGEMEVATTCLEIDGDVLEVDRLETSVCPQRLSEDEASAIGELLEVVFEEPASDEPLDLFGRADGAAGSLPGGVDLFWPDEESTPADDEEGLGAEGQDLGHDVNDWATPAGSGAEEQWAPAAWDDGGEAEQPEAAPFITRVVEATRQWSVVDEQPGVLVGVLGPIEISGGEAVIDRGKSIELVVYLAMHRRARMDADVVMEALWPGKAKTSSTLNTTTTTARTCLGKDAEGALYLPRISGGGDRLYRISDLVRLDYEIFLAHVRRAAGQEGAEAVASLRCALSLVRGRPFEVLGKGYEWAHVGLATRMAEDVADAAHRMAMLCLAAGDPEGARWAAQQGLLASEGNEQLYRDRMSAEHLNGNLAGVKAVMEDLATVVDAEEPYGSIHPDTVAHFKELTGAAAR